MFSIKHVLYHRQNFCVNSNVLFKNIVIMVLTTFYHEDSFVCSFTCTFKIPRMIGEGGLCTPNMLLLRGKSGKLVM